MKHTVNHSRTAALCLLFCMALGVACTAQAQTWVASTGAVDESSLLTYEFIDKAVYIRSSLSTGKVVLRYNVLPVGDLAVPLTQPCCEGRALVVRFIDNGSGAQVLVKLKQYNIFTGATTTLLSFDSNNSTPRSGFQTTPITSVGSFFNFSFADGPYNGGTNQGGGSVYYLEATLIRSAPGGTPALASISIVKELAP